MRGKQKGTQSGLEIKPFFIFDIKNFKKTFSLDCFGSF